MNPLKKLQKKLRELFAKPETEHRGAVTRLERAPMFPDGIDPQIAAYDGQPAYASLQPPHTFVGHGALSASIQHIPALQAASVEEPSRLRGPFTPEYPAVCSAEPSRIPTARLGRNAPQAPSYLSNAVQWEAAVAPMFAPQARAGQNTYGGTAERAVRDPFSLQDLQQALPVIETPAAANKVRPIVSALPKLGTYGHRYNEQRRLGISAPGVYECEHVIGYSEGHPNVDRTSPQGTRLADGMPAYYEPFQLHQEHPGSRNNYRVLDPKIHGGWENPGEYRHHQRETLRDPVAKTEGTSASNAYQLNALGYAHILASEANGLSRPSFIPKYLSQDRNRAPPKLPPYYYMPQQDVTAADSFNHMVRHDPPIIHRLNGNEETVRLGHQGQVEALVARGAATSRIWPTEQAIGNVARELLPPPEYKEKQDAWKAAGAHLPDPPPLYRARDRQHDRTISII